MLQKKFADIFPNAYVPAECRAKWCSDSQHSARNCRRKDDTFENPCLWCFDHKLHRYIEIEIYTLTVPRRSNPLPILCLVKSGWNKSVQSYRGSKAGHAAMTAVYNTSAWHGSPRQHRRLHFHNFIMLIIKGKFEASK